MNLGWLINLIHCHSELVSESVGSGLFDKPVFSSKRTRSKSFNIKQHFIKRYKKIDGLKKLSNASKSFPPQLLKQVQNDKAFYLVKTSREEYEERSTEINENIKTS